MCTCSSISYVNRFQNKWLCLQGRPSGSDLALAYLGAPAAGTLVWLRDRGVALIYRVRLYNGVCYVVRVVRHGSAA